MELTMSTEEQELLLEILERRHRAQLRYRSAASAGLPKGSNWTASNTRGSWSWSCLLSYRPPPSVLNYPPLWDQEMLFLDRGGYRDCLVLMYLRSQTSHSG